jgi:hypothetical protein
MAFCVEVQGEFVERRCPSSSTGGVAGDSGMGHHHLRAATTEVLELDAYLK